MNLLFKSKNNATVVTSLLIKELGVKISDLAINDILEEHPDYPQLKAISDSLDEWHLPNQAYDIKREDYDPSDLYFPFIAHLKEGGYILIHDITAKKVCFSDEKHNKAIIDEEEFLNRWSSVALHTTITEKSGELNYRENRLKGIFNQYKLPLVVLTLLGLILLKVNDQTLNFHYGFLLGLKIVGLGVSVLLLTHSIDANNPLIRNLCNLGKKNNCNAILKSDAAKITSWLSWSEVGFFYFAGSLLALLFAPSSLSLLTWLNLFALPYTVYSISYQYRHKNWCILCCSVQVLLVLETVTFLSSQNFEFLTLAFADLPNFGTTTLTSFLVPILGWYFLKSFFVDAGQIRSLKQQLKKFKYNSSLFNQALKNQPKYAVPDDLMPIVLGNPNAETTITMVSNAFCIPCAKAHETIDKWLRTRDDLKVKIIFITSTDKTNNNARAGRHVMALSLLKDTEIVGNALKEWYTHGGKKYELWAKKYPVEFNDEMDMISQKQNAWFDMAEITVTPTIMVNGYKLPDPYRLEDIKYLLS